MELCCLEVIRNGKSVNISPSNLEPSSVCGSETPLSVALQSGLSLEGIRLLVLGGAHMDFRSRDGMTPLHKAVRAHNHAGLLVGATLTMC